jgi:Ca2+-binding EF-hand superfamily protein
MLTVFRCFVGDCSNPNGTPLVPMLYDIHGSFFLICYIIVTCFVMFGVFNLVMAIFVENTLEAARLNQKKRAMFRQSEAVRVAKELQEVVVFLLSGGAQPEIETNRIETPEGRRSMFGRLLQRADSIASMKDVRQSNSGENMAMAVTFDDFVALMGDERVQEKLDDLEIHISDKDKMFEIIDSNGNGALDVNELIEGLMKLRGPADKGDAVSAALMVRQAQRDINKLEREMHQWNKTLMRNQNRILQRLQG